MSVELLGVPSVAAARPEDVIYELGRTLDVIRQNFQDLQQNAIAADDVDDAWTPQLILDRADLSDITGNSNDLLVETDRSNMYVQATGAYDLTGLEGGANGLFVMLCNKGTNTVTLKHQNTSSAAINRFLFSTAADVLLKQDSTVMLCYDSDKERWRDYSIPLTSIGIGSGVANRVAYWTGASTLSHSANLTFDGTTLNLTGPLQISSTTLFEADRDLAVSLIPNADNSLTLGSSARRFSTINFGTSLNWFAAAGAANPVFYVGDDGGGNVSLSFGAGGASAVDITLLRGAANRLDLASGDSLNLLSGSVTANTLNLKDAVNQIVLDSDAAVNTGTITMAALTAARTWTLPDASGTFLFGTGVANQVAYFSATNAVVGDADLTFDGTILTALQQLRVGSVTDTATQGDFSAGLVTAARTFYDQSAATQYWYNSGNVVRYTMDSAAQLFTMSARIDADITLNNTSGTFNGYDFNLLSGPGSASSAALRGILSVLRTSGTANFTGALEGVRGEISIATTGTTSLAIGAAYFTAHTSTGTTSTLEGARFTIQNTNASGTVTNAIGCRVMAPTVTGAITNFWGLYIEDPVGPTTANAIVTFGGHCIFNENGGDYDFRIEGDNKPNCALLDASDDEIAVDGRFSLVALSPASITANQNDYNPESAALDKSSFWRLTSDAARTITGIANGLDGRLLVIRNVGSFNLTFSHQSGSSSAANRMIAQSGADIVVAPNATLGLIYDNTTQRWQELF